jgi:hypothetical protein
MQMTNKEVPMKQKTLTSVCKRLHVVDSLAQMSDGDYTRLTQNGPILNLGAILLTEEAFANVPKKQVWLALGLHHCGQWGAIDRQVAIENEEQLYVRGSVISRWRIEDRFEFTIETDLEPGKEQTNVCVAPRSASVFEAPSSLVRLGDVLLDDACSTIPMNRIWDALEKHRTGSPGEHDRFPRQGFPPEQIHVSWWGEASRGAWYHGPFTVFTLITESPFTLVTGMTGSTASAAH